MVAIREAIARALEERAAASERFMKFDLVYEVAEAAAAPEADVEAELDAMCVAGELERFGYARSGDAFAPAALARVSVAARMSSQAPLEIEPFPGRVGRTGGIESIVVAGTRWFFGFDFQTEWVLSPLIADPNDMSVFASRYMVRPTGRHDPASWRKLVDEAASSSALASAREVREFSAAMLERLIADLRNAAKDDVAIPAFSLPEHLSFLLGASCAWETSPTRMVVNFAKDVRLRNALASIGHAGAEDWSDTLVTALAIVRGADPIAAPDPGAGRVLDAAVVIAAFLEQHLLRAPANWPTVFAIVKDGLKTIEPAPSKADRKPAGHAAPKPRDWRAWLEPFDAALRAPAPVADLESAAKSVGGLPSELRALLAATDGVVAGELEVVWTHAQIVERSQSARAELGKIDGMDEIADALVFFGSGSDGDLFAAWILDYGTAQIIRWSKKNETVDDYWCVGLTEYLERCLRRRPREPFVLSSRTPSVVRIGSIMVFELKNRADQRRTLELEAPAESLDAVRAAWRAIQEREGPLDAAKVSRIRVEWEPSAEDRAFILETFAHASLSFVHERPRDEQWQEVRAFRQRIGEVVQVLRDDGQLFPVLRTVEKGDLGEAIVSRTLAGVASTVVSVASVMLTPHETLGFSLVTNDELAASNAKADDLFRAAMDNLTKSLCIGKSETLEGDMFVFTHTLGLGTSALALPDFYEKASHLARASELFVAFVCSDELLVTAMANRRLVEKLRSQVASAERRGYVVPACYALDARGLRQLATALLN